MPRAFRSRLPLQWRLPLAFSAVLLATVAGVSWLAYTEVSRSARYAAVERLESVTGQLAGSLGTRTRRDVARMERTADSSALRTFLRTGDVRAREDALRVLNGLVEQSSTPRAVELRDLAGRSVLSAVGAGALPADGETSFALAGAVAERRAAVGNFAVIDGRIAWPTFAPVMDDGGALGYLVEWSYLNTTRAEREGASKLIGAGSALFIGSKNGVWTDQVQPVTAPPVDVAAAGPVSFERAGLGRRLAVTAPVPATPWLILVEFSQARVLAPAQRFLRRVALTALLLCLLALGTMVLLVRRITQPLRAITTAAETLSTGDYSRRVGISGDDEIARLGSTFDTMAERIEETHERLEENIRELRDTREQFYHAQRMEATGRLAGGVAHDFNNLLTVILGELDLANALEMPPAARESLHEVRRAGERAAGLTRQLLAFSRRQVLETSVFDVNALLCEVERLLTRVIGADVTLVIRPRAERPMVRADRGQIEQVIVNLAINARDAMPQGGQLFIETVTVTLDEDYARARNDVTPGEYVMIAVSDTGTGMSDDVVAHVFEPFFTTKPRGKGTGLGLASSYGITRQVGGHIAAYSEPGVGTTMRVYLPWADDAPDTETPATADRQVSGGVETILLVEDEGNVREVALRMLGRYGYSVLPATDAGEALALAQNHDGPIHLLLTDVVLPTMGGEELAERVVSVRPETRVVFTSGYTGDFIQEHRSNGAEFAFLQKPYTADSLAAKLRDVLDS